MHDVSDEDAEAEAQALTAIMGDDLIMSAAREFELFVLPECDPMECVGSVVLTVRQPPGYPHSAAAHVEIAGTSAAGHAFEHRGQSWQLNSEHAIALRSVVDKVAAEKAGEPMCWDMVEAVREWLRDNTTAPKPEPTAATPGAADEQEDDDDDLDESDMDEEMISCLRDVLRGGGPLVRQLDLAEAMTAGSKQQKAALLDIWRGLTDAQREEMVASDENSSDDEQEEGRGGARARPSAAAAHHGRADGDGGKRAAIPPPPAQRACPKGHALTAGCSKPADYRRLEGNEGNCDVCDADFKYSAGGYHCDTCKNWDCCVRCGSTPLGGGGSASVRKTASKGKNRSSKR